MKISIISVKNLFIYLYIITVVVFPLNLDFLVFKGVLVIIIVLFTIIENLFYRNFPKITKRLWIILLLFIGYSFYSSIYGYAIGAPGALKQAQIYIVWPLVYTYIFINVKSFEIFKNILRIIEYSLIIVIVYGIQKVLHYLSFISFELSFETSSFLEGVSVSNFFLEMSYPGLNSMAFGIGFIISVIALNYIYNRKFILNITLFISLLIFMFFSGRRVFSILYIIGVFLILFISNKSSFNNRKVKFYLYHVFGAVIFLIFLYYNQYLDEVFHRIMDAFSSSSPGTMVKIETIKILLSGWADSFTTILIGHGHGSFSSLITRSTDMPWSYEVYYVALLYQTGLIGIFIYLGSYIYISALGINMFNRKKDFQIFLPLVFGLITLLIASFTNPYLARFDSIWVMFLIIGMINNLNKY